MTAPKLLTIAQAAERFGVSKQRMHQLIQIHGCKVTMLNPRMSLISAAELRKIPKDRPTGVHFDDRA